MDGLTTFFHDLVYMILIFVSLFLIIISYMLTKYVRVWTIRKSILDIPNNRSSHTIPTPRGGGLAIVITWYIGLTFLYLNHWVEANLFFSLLIGVALVVISFIDDVYSIRPSFRLFIQLLVSAIALYILGGIDKIEFGLIHISSGYLTNIFAFIFIVWFINLFNFLDGIDGYLGAETIFICITAFLFIGSWPLLILASAILGFLILNWQPAKIFMGDVGSTLLGFTIAIFSIYYNNTQELNIVIWLILSSVFWFDATITLLRRLFNREKISQAHRKHAYQRLVQSGFSHQKTVIYSVLVNIILAIMAYVAFQYSQFTLSVFCMVVLFLFILMKVVDKRKPFDKDIT